MFRSNRVQILRRWRQDIMSAYRGVGKFLQCRKFYSVANNTSKVDRNYELLGFKSLFWRAATSPTCVAKVTNILVLAKNILL